MTPQTYTEAVQYLFERLPMFHRIGSAAYKKDLTNTIALCAAIGNPQERLTCIHVAGTNGKGSTSSMIAAALTAAGYRTGLFTSPHLRTFTERIRIDGREMPEADVVDFVQRIMPVMDEVQPSFFECTVAMAFDHFARQQVDVAVIEVGMGGRLDSTNIITPVLSVITNISWDHMDLLGSTLPAIAAEKAGIIKRGVPVVIGEEQEEVRSVFVRQAQQVEAPILFASELVHVAKLTQSWEHQRFAIGLRGHAQEVVTDLVGDYQERNIGTAWLALDLLRDTFPRLTQQAILSGLSQVKKLTGLAGRMMVLGHHPLTLTDVAHNEAGVKWLLGQLMAQPFHRLHMVWGMVGDKDISKVLGLLPQDATYYFVRPDIPRGLDAHALRERAAAFNLQGEVYPSVRLGLEAARAAAQAGDMVFVGGSTFVVAEVV